ncbi:type I-E CRISPR-associated protein Cse2/CasB [Breoghania sp.]|uniref:type I-E CRISPR-associated protein Cse2/CasB n=1 Tax=Breoghania sp. TaxID=2065378 RepID=UPI0029CA19EE|nr:type I-E CRISPR-associated protein Cse2/CasB [Breoghania sp.]
MRLAREDETAMTAIIGWWRMLHPDADGSGGDRAGRARLRRATSPLDALLEPETHALIARFAAAAGGRWPKGKKESATLEMRLAVLALALAQIEPNQTSAERFASAVGRTPDGRYPGKDDRRRLSPARFGALLRASDDPETFARLLRRALRVLRQVPFSVPQFIRDILAFDDEVRRDWTFQYHHTRRDADEFAETGDALEASDA